MTKFLHSLQLPLLEVTLEEEQSRRSVFSKIDNWFSCVEQYQREYERRLAPQRLQLLMDAGLSVDIYEKSVETHHKYDDFMQVINTAFWFAQRQILTMQKPSKITSHQYFTYLNNELTYLENHHGEIEHLVERVPPSGRIYILAKRLEDYVWKKTHLSFIDRLAFELTNTEEVGKSHYQQLKEEINTYYENLDTAERKRSVQLLTQLNTEASSTPREQLLVKQKTLKGISNDGSTTGSQISSKYNTARSKNLSEPLGSGIQIKGTRLFPTKEDEELNEGDVELSLKQDGNGINKEINIETEKETERQLLQNDDKIQINELKSLKQADKKQNEAKRVADLRLLKLLQNTYTSYNDYDLKTNLSLEELEDRAIEEAKTKGCYSRETVLCVYEQICLQAMESLKDVLEQERKEKQLAFTHLSKWLSLDKRYNEIREAELKKQEEGVFSRVKISNELYKQGLQVLEEESDGELIHYMFWSALFTYKQSIEGKEAVRLDIPAGELVDFYVWRERAISHKAEMKTFKSAFQTSQRVYATCERIKNFVEQHRKRPYEEYAFFIIKKPKLVKKRSGCHKLRFEQSFSSIMNDRTGKSKDMMQIGENRKSCCQIF